MKKIINPGTDVVTEQLEGFLDAYSSFYERVPGSNALMLKERRSGDKVSLIIGGGSGHEPMFAGFVGRGLADAAVCGNIFTSPNPQLIYETALAVNNQAGVLFLYGNYAGDNMNFDMAEEMLDDDGIKSAHYRVIDDCASAPKERKNDRRGIAGDVLAVKIMGAACDDGLSLEELCRLGEKLSENMSTIGLATSPGTIPGLEKPTFSLGEDEIEYGMGIHGEPGIERTTMKPANELCDRLYSELKKEMGFVPGQEICILINGLGSTTLLEMNIVYKRIAELARQDGLIIHDSDINSYCTCQEMGGFSVTFLVLDEQLRKYYDEPCYSPYYFKEGKK